MNTISFPHMFNKNRYTLSTSLSYNYQSINESLKSLLLTRPGELLGDPEYGCRMLINLFDIKSNGSIEDLKSNILLAINKYIPEINVNDIRIYESSNNNKYKITISYKLKPYIDDVIFELVI